MTGYLCDTCRNMLGSYEPADRPHYVHCVKRWTVRKVKKWDDCFDYEAVGGEAGTVPPGARAERTGDDAE